MPAVSPRDAHEVAPRSGRRQPRSDSMGKGERRSRDAEREREGWSLADVPHAHADAAQGVRRRDTTTCAPRDISEAPRRRHRIARPAGEPRTGRAKARAGRRGRDARTRGGGRGHGTTRPARAYVGAPGARCLLGNRGKHVPTRGVPPFLRSGKMGTIQLSPRASLAQPSFFSKVERTPAAGHAAAAAHRGGAPDVGLRSSSPGVRARGADVRVVRRLPELDGVGGRVNLATRVAPPTPTPTFPRPPLVPAPPLTPVVVVTPPAVLSFIPAGAAARANLAARDELAVLTRETRRVERSQTRSAPPAISAFPIPVPRGAPRRPRRRSAREVLCGIHSSSAGSRHPSAFATRARRAASATDRSRASARGASTASSRRRHPRDKRPRPAPGQTSPSPPPGQTSPSPPPPSSPPPGVECGVPPEDFSVCGEARRRGPVRVLRILPTAR